MSQPAAPRAHTGHPWRAVQGTPSLLQPGETGPFGAQVGQVMLPRQPSLSLGSQQEDAWPGLQPHSVMGRQLCCSLHIPGHPAGPGEGKWRRWDWTLNVEAGNEEHGKPVPGATLNLLGCPTRFAGFCPTQPLAQPS